MKLFAPIIIIASIILFAETGCKKAIEDSIDCVLESTLLSIHAEADTANAKLIHFEFVNNDTDGDFTLEPTINWNFGDGSTESSTNHKVDHTYTAAGSYKVTATYTLKRGTASCSGPKEKDITVN